MIVTKVVLNEPGQTAIQYLNGLLVDTMAAMPVKYYPVDPPTGKTFVELDGQVFEVVGDNSLQEIELPKDLNR